jgi:hypothetical protein
MSDITNILKNDDELSEELLLKYAEGNLTEEERHAIESKMIDSDFMSDAAEGLGNFKNKKDIQQYITYLNQQLQKQVQRKKNRKAKRKLQNMDWVITAVVIVLLLTILGYTVLHLYHSKKQTATEIRK